MPASPRDPYDAYLHQPSDLFNEHQSFMRAKGELQKHHHEKVTKVKLIEHCAEIGLSDVKSKKDNMRIYLF